MNWLNEWNGWMVPWGKWKDGMDGLAITIDISRLLWELWELLWG
jgi:hypothetical protein